MGKFWDFSMQASGAGALTLYGEISDTSWFGDEVTPAAFLKDLEALGEIGALDVYINSPGGDVFAGYAIYHMLRRHPARVTVHVDGLAASAASVVAMAGDRIVMPAASMMMVHRAWTLACGDAARLLDIAAELEKPGRDPREEMPGPILRTDVLEMKDLKPGMILKGTVRNVIDFGAFVDIGVHQDGLVHISKMGGRKFVKHPLEVVSVGDIVEVKILDVDLKRKRISLTMNLDEKETRVDKNPR